MQTVRAQESSNSRVTGPKDIIIFRNGEKLVGVLKRSSDDAVIFKSEMAGEVNVKWSDIQELRTAGDFALIEKGTRLRTGADGLNIHLGTVDVVDGSVMLKEAPTLPPLTLPLTLTANLVDRKTFARVVLSRPAWYRNWKGTATLGVSLVRATQTNQTYNSSANFVRDVPGEDWMDPETRTTLSFTSAFGQLTQPNTPLVKTSIFRALAERDRYFSPRGFTFFHTAFDHDYSQGLDLQQLYSMGVGLSVIKSKNEQLDLRSAIGYKDQKFFDPTQNQHLVGSVFSESYDRRLEKLTFHQFLSITPSWSNLNAYSATGTVALTVPIFKRISFTISATEGFLNNPSPTFRKSSFQLGSAVTYKIQ